MTQAWAIEAHDLVKTFGTNRAVDGVDLLVETGTVYGVLGPNGAGKTTTIRMLATLLRADSGTATVFGHNVFTEPTDVPNQRRRPRPPQIRHSGHQCQWSLLDWSHDVQHRRPSSRHRGGLRARRRGRVGASRARAAWALG